jgi:hypothetical protein
MSRVPDHPTNAMIEVDDLVKLDGDETPALDGISFDRAAIGKALLSIGIVGAVLQAATLWAFARLAL